MNIITNKRKKKENMKELTTREIAAVKRQFKNSLPAMKKIESIDQKIAKLQ